MRRKISNNATHDNAVEAFSLYRRSLRLCTSSWTVILAALAIIGLLMAFYQVVRGVVMQAELRRQAIATHADATWRCKTLVGLRASEDCLMQLQAAPHGGAMLQAQMIAGGALID